MRLIVNSFRFGPGTDPSWRSHVMSAVNNILIAEGIVAKLEEE